MSQASNKRVVDPVLTEIVRGYSNEEFVAEAIFPEVPVPKEAGQIPEFGKEAFRINNTERGMRAKSNRISPEGITKIPFQTTEHDLEYPVDYREDEESMWNEQEYGAYVAQTGIELRREKMAADLATNPSNYPTGNKLTLSGTSQFTHASSDPLGVVEDGKEAVRGKIIKRPNIIVVGAATHSALKKHAQFKDYIKYTRTPITTEELLAEFFEVDRYVVGRAAYVNNANTPVDVWGDFMIMAYVPRARSNVPRNMYEPSFGYTLRRNNFPEADMYEENGGKISLVRSTDNYEVKIVGSDAGYLVSDTNG